MKKIIYLLVFFLISTSVLAQKVSNVIIFDDNGNEFTVFLNGQQKNETPTTNVKVTGLKADAYQLKIKFNDASLKSFKKPLLLNEKGKEYTFKIHQKRNGKFTLRPVSQRYIKQVQKKKPEKKHVRHANQNAAQQTTTVSHSETHKTKNNPKSKEKGESVNFKMNINQKGVDMSVNNEKGETADVDVNINAETSTSQTTTTTTTTTTTNTFGETQQESEQQNNTTGNGNCMNPMSSMDFQEAKSSIKSKTFSDSKLTMAKQIVKNECLKAGQIKEIMMLFDYEDTRLEFAKYAYDYVFNPRKYYKVNDAFDYEMTIEELNEYINNK